MIDRKALVLYVWDGEEDDIVGLFRAIGSGDAAARRGFPWPWKPLPRTFDIADIRAFAARLSARYPSPRYAIRDWLAESLEDFFVTRYKGTRAEFAESTVSRLPDPFATSEPSAAPIPLGDYQRWNPTGIEISHRPLGFESVFEGDVPLFEQDSGRYSVLKKDAVERDMRAHGLDPAEKKHMGVYFSELRAKGFRIYSADHGLPSPRVLSATSNSEAQEVFLHRAEMCAHIDCFVVPRDENELRRTLHRLYPHAEIHFWQAAEQRYFFDGRSGSKNQPIHTWVVTHRLECLRVFGTDRLCADMR